MTEPREKISDDDLLVGISNALRAKNWEAVSAFLHVLAVQAPDQAQAILDAIDGKITVRIR